MNKTLLIVIVIFGMTAPSYGMARVNPQENKEDAEKEQPEKPPADEKVFCTMDAKMCPDGSFVGRIPPDCRFAPCPGDKKREGDK